MDNHFDFLDPEIQKLLIKSFYLYEEIQDCSLVLIRGEEKGLLDETISKLYCTLLAIVLDYENVFNKEEISIKDFLENVKVLDDFDQETLLELEMDLNINNLNIKFLKKVCKDKFKNIIILLGINKNDTIFDFIYKFINMVLISIFISDEKQENLTRAFSNILADVAIGLNLDFGEKNSKYESPTNIELAIESNFLEKHGTDLTAKKYVFNPAIGREDLIEKLAITINTPTKSAILIGNPEVGKTAIVEGFAKEIQDKKFLTDKKVIEIQASSLIAGKGFVGSFEATISNLIEEIKEEKNIILFIDEIHQIYKMGSGTEQNVMNMFKKFISEGELKIIGSTTKEEFDETIKRDSAFVDRFDTFFVPELKEVKLKKILSDRIEFLENYYDVYFPFQDERKNKFINYLIDITKKENRQLNQMCYNPRLVIQIIDTIFSCASIKQKNSIEVEDIIYSITNCPKLRKNNIYIPNILEKTESRKKIINLSSYRKLSLK